MARLGSGAARPAQAAAGKISAGRRAATALLIFAASVVVAIAVQKWVHDVPTLYLDAWFAAAAVFAVVVALMMPRPSAVNVGLFAALAVGVLVGLPQAQDAVANGAAALQHAVKRGHG